MNSAPSQTGGRRKKEWIDFLIQNPNPPKTVVDNISETVMILYRSSGGISRASKRMKSRNKFTAFIIIIIIYF